MKTIFAIFTLIFIFGCSTVKEMNHKAVEDIFVIERTFSADQKTVFYMWANPQEFTSWLGPDGADMKFLSVNNKEGGTSLWSMTINGGSLKHGQINYKKISPDNLMVYTQNFSDKDGHLTKPFFSNTYPDMLKTTVTFTKEGKDKTHVRVKWEIEGKATEDERQTFIKMKPNMTEGWNQSFDKLEKLLQKK